MPDWILPDWILPDWILPDWILPDWILPDWLDPKLIVLFVLIGTVLFLSRDHGQRTAPERARGGRRIAALIKRSYR
jgi:hypothetical protein